MNDANKDKSFEIMDVKEPITYDEQVNRIVSKGFIIEDIDSCKEFLKQTNYYRLLAYYLPFKKKDGTYTEGIPFTRIQRIYEFDSQLRNIIFNIIEQIEIYLRTQIAYYLSFEYGPLGYLDSTIFNSCHKDEVFKEKISSCIEENKRTPVVQHYTQKYGCKFPLWVIIEFFSVGTLSYLYSDLLTKDKKQISSLSFHTSADCLRSWLRCLTDLRNRCAHYSRLYYWIFSAIPKTPKNASYEFDRKLFSQILMLKYLYPDRNKWNSYVFISFEALINKYISDISLKHIGFPENWKELLKA